MDESRKGLLNPLLSVNPYMQVSKSYGLAVVVTATTGKKKHRWDSLRWQLIVFNHYVLRCHRHFSKKHLSVSRRLRFSSVCISRRHLRSSSREVSFTPLFLFRTRWGFKKSFIGFDKIP